MDTCRDNHQSPRPSRPDLTVLPGEYVVCRLSPRDANPLAEAGLSVFAIASYDTDHLLVRDLAIACVALFAAGHRVCGHQPG